MEKAEEQQNNSKVPPQLQPHVFKKGQSGNPGGRPKGSISLKEYAKKMLAGMSEQEAEEFLQGIDKKVIWEMAEGKAPQTTESKVEVTLPKPLLDNVRTNNSDKEAPGTG